MTRYVRMTMMGVALCAMAAGAAWAQIPQPTPGTGMTADRPAATAAATSGMVEGTVKKVDPMAGTLRVSSGLFGLFGKTLQIGPDTQVSVDGRDSNLAEIREGAKVKASYETRNGRTVATRIEAIPSAQPSSRRSG
jgi:colicin import membrane protein